MLVQHTRRSSAARKISAVTVSRALKIPSWCPPTKSDPIEMHCLLPSVQRKQKLNLVAASVHVVQCPAPWDSRRVSKMAIALLLLGLKNPPTTCHIGLPSAVSISSPCS